MSGKSLILLQLTFLLPTLLHLRVESKIYYNLKQRKHEIQTFASGGSVVPIINKTDFSNLEIYLPSLQEQIKISSILSSFDNKIELNQRMNETLEGIARAVFKSWFVDFDPVRAKMAGEPFAEHAKHPLPDEIMTLFPDELVESELGLIPKVWEVKKLENIATITDCLHSKKPNKVSDGRILLQVYNIGDKGNLDLSEKYYISDENYNIWIRRFEVSPGDIIISKTGRVGAVAHIPNGFHGALGRNLVGIRANKQKINESYLRDLMLSHFMKDEITKNTSLGTILRSIHVKHISQLQLILPHKQILKHYKRYIHGIHNKINLNNKVIRILTEQRDALLFSLIQNQIDECNGILND